MPKFSRVAPQYKLAFEIAGKAYVAQIMRCSFAAIALFFDNSGLIRCSTGMDWLTVRMRRTLN